MFDCLQVESLMKGKGREFMHSNRLGYLCTCPTNIGTGLRCSVHVQLRNLSKVSRHYKVVQAESNTCKMMIPMYIMTIQKYV